MKLNVNDLVEQGLVRKKTYTEGKYKGLSVLKYTKKVFFKRNFIRASGSDSGPAEVI